MGTPTLESGWAEQSLLQRELNDQTYPVDFDDERKMQFIKDMILACTDELHEALGEVGWKPWASSRHINRDGYVSELVDAWQFLMNLMQAVGVTPEELATKLYHKHMINWRRVRDGYSGTDKCPKCKRALDDVHVTCTAEKCMSDHDALAWGDD